MDKDMKQGYMAEGITAKSICLKAQDQIHRKLWNINKIIYRLHNIFL